MSKKMKSLEVLALESMIKNVVLNIGPFTTSPETIIALNPRMTNIPGIHRSLENLICHSKCIRRFSKYFLHLVFNATAKLNVSTHEYSKICKDLVGNMFQLNARLKFDRNGSELLIYFENGMVGSKELDMFLIEVKAFFGIDQTPIGTKSTFVFARPKSSIQNDDAVSKVFFQPLRNYEGVDNEQMEQYTSKSLYYSSKVLSNQLSNTKKGAHMFTITDYDDHIFNFQTCPCQSYICSGGLDSHYHYCLRVCKLNYCDTHPFFKNKA